MNFKYFIKQLRKSAVILKDENAFREYIKDHSNYREDTKFIVDGVEREAPPKKKKTTSYKEDELKTIGEVFKGAFRALEGKGYELDKLTPEQTEKFHKMLNGILEKNNIRPLSKEEFKEMFVSEINKRFPKKEDKKEVPPKQEEPKQEENSREQTLEKIYNNPTTNAYVIGNMSRKDYFDYVNGSLKDSGQEELTEDEFKDFLREKVFDFKPSQKRSVQTSYTKKHFAKKVNWGEISIEDVNTINQTLTELIVDYPEMDETFDVIRQNSRFDSNVWAVYREKPIGLFNNGITNYLDLNSKSEIFSENFIPFRHNPKKQLLAISRGRNYRSCTGDDGENRQEAIARTVTHEIGHKLFAKRKRYILGIGKEEGLNAWREATLLEMDWESLRTETIKSGEISKISNYAKTNLYEFFAECFTMYRFERENLPKNVLKKMEGFIKWCSMMK